ncbi:MAG: hypothetical protein JJT89_03750 [Nitriliruptoraceae bacterium]|nr:hypothetical protein [Nitriliruptoraceae bacterium]
MRTVWMDPDGVRAIAGQLSSAAQEPGQGATCPPLPVGMPEAFTRALVAATELEQALLTRGGHHVGELAASLDRASDGARAADHAPFAR